MRRFTTVFGFSIFLCFAATMPPTHAETSQSAEATSQNQKAAHWVIEDTHSYVGFARVNLSIGELFIEEDKLVGTYQIRIPFNRSKNDQGRIELKLREDTSPELLNAHGGRLTGKAISDDADRPLNTIECNINTEEKTIFLTITTPDRSIDFESTYAFFEASSASAEEVRPAKARTSM